MRGIKVTVVQQVIDFIKGSIESGQWTVGSKIPSEHDLTEILEVSRASVRVAIHQFIAVGVLESLHGKGTFVRKIELDAFGRKDSRITRTDFADLRKVLEFRRILETESTCLAASYADEGNLERLRRYLALMNESIGDSQRFIRADMLFHEEIAEASRNHLLSKTLKQVFDETGNDHKRINDIFGYKDGIYYHTIILKAIGDRDPKAAKKLMFEHLQQAIDRLDE